MVRSTIVWNAVILPNSPFNEFNEYNIFFSCDGSVEFETSIETDISLGVHLGASKYDFEYYDVLCSWSMHLHKITKISPTK